MLTIFQALKKIKQLDRKIEKNQERIERWCSYIAPIEEPQYDTTKLMQAVTDLLAEKAKLRHALHATNAMFVVEYKGKNTTIDELLLLSTVTIPTRIATLSSMRRKEKPYHLKGEDAEKAKVVLQYDPNERDRTIDGLENELAEINDLLDEINISTDVLKFTE